MPLTRTHPSSPKSNAKLKMATPGDLVEDSFVHGVRGPQELCGTTVDQIPPHLRKHSSFVDTGQSKVHVYSYLPDRYLPHPYWHTLLGADCTILRTVA